MIQYHEYAHWSQTFFHRDNKKLLSICRPQISRQNISEVETASINNTNHPICLKVWMMMLSTSSILDCYTYRKEPWDVSWCQASRNPKGAQLKPTLDLRNEEVFETLLARENRGDGVPLLYFRPPKQTFSIKPTGELVSRLTQLSGGPKLPNQFFKRILDNHKIAFYFIYFLILKFYFSAARVQSC